MPHNGVSMPRLYSHQLFTFNKQSPKFSQDNFPYYNIFPNKYLKVDDVLLQTMRKI